MRKNFLYLGGGAFFLLSILFLNFVVPPFQNPDEPQHFGGIMVEAWGEEEQQEVEQAIIAMMDKHNWWRLVGMGRPAELPKRLSEISFLMGYYPLQDFKQRLAGIKFYHLLVGKFFRLLKIKDISLAYYLCRLLSLLLTLGGVIFLFLTIRLFKASLQGFLWPTFLFILFLPQFLISSLGVNSDALANFLGAAFFWTMAMLLRGKGRKEVLYSIFIGVAMLGFLVDRSTFLLVPLVLVGSFFLIEKKRYQESIVDLLMLVIIFLFLAITFVNLFPLLAENNFMWFSRVYQRLAEAVPVLFSLGREAREFLVFIADSFLVKFGWAVFGVGAGIYYLWRTIILAVIVGLMVGAGSGVWRGIWGGWLRLKEVYYGGMKMGRRRGRKKAMRIGRREAEGLSWRMVGVQIGSERCEESEERRWMSGEVVVRRGVEERDGKERSLVKKSVEERREEQNRPIPSIQAISLKFAIFSVLAVICQLLGAWSFYGERMLAQGRHFFPLIIPIAFLFGLGMKEFMKIVFSGKEAGLMITVGLVLFEFILLNYTIWAKLIPVFHLTISSPHPGI